MLFFFILSPLLSPDPGLSRPRHRLTLTLYSVGYPVALVIDAVLAGIDFATQQPNFAFQDTTLQRFANVTDLMNTDHMGVEMELGLTVRNTLIHLNATQSFYDYLDAGVRYAWMTKALKTYYNGNDFTVMATSDNATLSTQYAALCDFVAGVYPRH